MRRHSAIVLAIAAVVVALTLAWRGLQAVIGVLTLD